MDLLNKNIMITCGGGVGDLIMLTPALRSLKSNFGCKITVLTLRNKEILDGIPYIDYVIGIKRGQFLSRFRNVMDIKNQDVLIFTDWQPQILLQAHWLGVSVIAGVPREKHMFSKYFTKQLEYLYSSRNYIAETNAKVIEKALDISLTGDMTKCDVPQIANKDVQITDALLESIGLQGKEYIVFSPFTGFEQRNWGGEEANLLVKLIEEKYELPVLIIGTGDIAKKAARISKYSLAGKTSLLQIVEIIKRAVLLITPDSGPMHIAGATGTPVIPLFSKDLPSRWAPKNKCWPIYLALDCSPCDDDTARHCSRGVKCMNDITAAMILEKIEECFSEIGRPI